MSGIHFKKSIEDSLKTYDPDNDYRNSYFNTALLLAVIHDHMDIVQQLLADPSTNINAIDVVGRTALIQAIWNDSSNRYEICRI